MYDEAAKVLTSSFKFAEQYLTNETINTKRGRFLLVYSDISEKLGLCEENIVEKLCNQHKLVITNQWRVPFERKSREGDALNNIKNESSLLLYEIQKY